MQSYLHSLYITKENLKEIVALSKGDLWAHKAVKSKKLSILLIPILMLSGGLETGYVYYLIKWNWFRKQQHSILDEVDRYNDVIKALEISEQLVSAGNKSLEVTNRDKLISMLMITRENLICGLKTERILRKNRAFMAKNKELIASNLAALQVFSMNLEANEYASALNQALDIAQEVESEMKKIKGE
jgi:hypothetical protein